MKDPVNLYELMHAFWKENAYEPFATSEIALFFFLLNLANGRHWKMPIKCSTTLISGSIKVSRQTVITARAKLRCRGLISFTEGSRNGEIPSYSINLDCKKWQADSGELKETPSHKPCKDLTANLPPSSTSDLTVELTPDLTHLNNKDKRLENKDVININNSDCKKFKIDELEELFVSDIRWQKETFSVLTPDKDLSEDIVELIRLFFQELRCQGYDEREEKDCRMHLFNWLKKYLNKHHYGKDKRRKTQRNRGTEVPVAEPDSYEGSF